MKGWFSDRTLAALTAGAAALLAGVSALGWLATPTFAKVAGPVLVIGVFVMLASLFALIYRVRLQGRRRAAQDTWASPAVVGAAIGALLITGIGVFGLAASRVGAIDTHGYSTLPAWTNPICKWAVTNDHMSTIPCVTRARYLAIEEANDREAGGILALLLAATSIGFVLRVAAPSRPVDQKS